MLTKSYKCYDYFHNYGLKPIPNTLAHLVFTLALFGNREMLLTRKQTGVKILLLVPAGWMYSNTPASIYNVANKYAAFALIVGLVNTELIHLWRQLLQLACHPSFYLLLVSVQENCEKAWRQFMGVRGQILDKHWAACKNRKLSSMHVDLAVWMCSHFFHYCEN